MKNIFYELIVEAAVGKVVIDGDDWPIAFNTKIYKEDKEISYGSENNLSTLIIQNEYSFFELLTEYIMLELNLNRKTMSFYKEKQKNHVKMILAYLFANATTEDFLHPEDLIRRNISFIKDQTFNDLNNEMTFSINGQFFNSEIEVKNVMHSLSMETPYKLEIALIKYDGENKLTYPLPSISYGIENNVGGGVTCYIYSLMNPKRKKELTEQEIQYEKKINRFLYKLNEGIREQESKEYIEYKEGISDYYPENISDVSPSFVLSLVIFLTLLQKKNIQNIKVVPYLPVRYLSRKIAAEEINNVEKRESFLSRNNDIQYNATNKFIRTFMRAAFHMKDLNITSYPYEVDEFLNLHLSEKEHDIYNEILRDVANGIITTEIKNKR